MGGGLPKAPQVRRMQWYCQDQTPGCMDYCLSLLVSLWYSTSSPNLFSKYRPLLKLGKVPLGVSRNFHLPLHMLPKAWEHEPVTLRRWIYSNDWDPSSFSPADISVTLLLSACCSTFTRIVFQNNADWFNSSQYLFIDKSAECFKLPS